VQWIESLIQQNIGVSIPPITPIIRSAPHTHTTKQLKKPIKLTSTSTTPPKRRMSTPNPIDRRLTIHRQKKPARFKLANCLEIGPVSDCKALSHHGKCGNSPSTNLTKTPHCPFETSSHSSVRITDCLHGKCRRDDGISVDWRSSLL